MRFLIGAVSWNTPGSRLRRVAIRSHILLSQHTSLRFILPADEAEAVLRPDVTSAGHIDSSPDAVANDVWGFDVPQMARVIMGKYLLLNAFFRFAAQLPIEYVARMDDDSLINATAVAAEIFSAGRLYTRLVYGPMNQWYMWDPVSFTPSCYSYSSRRWSVSHALRLQYTASGTPIGQMSRAVRECTDDGLSGPFPYAGGGFTAYSATVVKELVQATLDTDEAHAIRTWSWFVRNASSPNDQTFFHPKWGDLAKRLKSHPGTATQRMTLARKLNLKVLEDVYFGHRMYHALKDKDIVCINAKNLNVGRNLSAAGRYSTPRAVVYHNLKHPKRFAQVAMIPKRHVARNALSCKPVHHPLGTCKLWRICTPSMRRRKE